MLRISVILLFVLMLLVDGTSFARSTTTSVSGRSFHKYYSGIIQSVSSAGLVLNGQEYTYSPNYRIRAHEKSKGAFTEVDGQSYEVREGASVVLKVEGSVIYEIIIERWKQ